MIVQYDFPVLRWQCGAGHFLADASVESEDAFDPGDYYGVTSRIWATCKVCGHVENPRIVHVGVTQIEVTP